MKLWHRCDAATRSQHRPIESYTVGREQRSLEHDEPRHDYARERGTGCDCESPSRQTVGDLLLHHTERRDVECNWLGRGYTRAYSGWHVSWADGPTIDDMRDLIAKLADQVPALDIHDLRYDRGSTDLGEAAALLRYLDTHPEQAEHVDTFTVESRPGHTQQSSA